MRRLMIAMLLFACFAAEGQTHQKGYTKTKGRLDQSGQVIPGTRLSDVSIILQGDNATVSDGDGDFELLVGSDKFYLKNVRKQGYVLTDPDILSKQYACSPNALIISLESPSDQLEDKLAAERKIRRTLQRQLQQREDEIEELKAQNKLTQEEYHAALQKLYADQENDEKLIGDMAERYSKMDFDMVDAFQREISNCILNGELSKADSLLNTKGSIDADIAEYRSLRQANAQEKRELSRRQKRLEKSIAYEQWQLEDIAQRCYNKFEIFKMRHELDSATYYIETRAELDTLNIQWQIDAGDFVGQFCADFNKMSVILTRALNNSIASFGENHIYVAKCYNIMGNMYSYQEKSKESVEYHLKALTIINRVGDNNYYELAMSYAGLGKGYAAIGEYELGLSYSNKAIDILKQIYGENNRDIAICYEHIGFAYALMAKYDTALEFYIKSQNILISVLGEVCYDTCGCYNNIAYIYQAMGSYDKAYEYYLKALNISTNLFNKNHPNILMIRNNIGSLYYMQKKYDESLKYFLMNLDAYLQVFGEMNVSTGRTYNNIAVIYFEQGIFLDKAIEYFLKSLNVHITILGETNPNIAQIYNNIANIYMRQSLYDKALEYNLKALNITNSVYEGPHPLVAGIYNSIGTTYYLATEYDKAIDYYSKVLEIRKQLFGENHPDIVRVYSNMSETYSKLGDENKANEYRQKAEEINAKLQNQ